MFGNVTERMALWPQVREMLDAVPIRRVWEIFDQMLIDRQKFIYGNAFQWYAPGIIHRNGVSYQRFSSFIPDLISIMNYYCCIYPPYPAESGLPVLDSFSNIVQYAERKYPDLHNEYTTGIVENHYGNVLEYAPGDCYKTADAGGDDEFAFLNHFQFFEKLWNLLHYFGGVSLFSNDRTYGIPYWETGGNAEYPGHSFSSSEKSYHSIPNSDGTFGGLRFFYTPADDLEYKYICHGLGSSESSPSADPVDSGIVTYRLGNVILYESDWMQGPFVSPWIKEAGNYAGQDGRVVIDDVRLNVYPRFPDLYDPETFEPVYF